MPNTMTVRDVRVALADLDQDLPLGVISADTQTEFRILAVKDEHGGPIIEVELED